MQRDAHLCLSLFLPISRFGFLAVSLADRNKDRQTGRQAGLGCPRVSTEPRDQQGEQWDSALQCLVGARLPRVHFGPFLWDWSNRNDSPQHRTIRPV